MRKLIFFIFFFPAVLALGHDIYVYTQNQEKGFRLSDIGAIWAKYDKENHDQWKIKLKDIEKDISENVSSVITQVQSDQKEQTNQDNEQKPDYATSIAQIDKKDKNETIEIPVTSPEIQKEASTTQNIVTLILEQKALLLFGGIALILYLLNAFFALLTRPKEGMAAIKKHKKESGYEYKRK